MSRLKISKELFNSAIVNCPSERDERQEMLYQIMVLGYTPARVATEFQISRQRLNWQIRAADNLIREQIGISGDRVVYYDFMPTGFPDRWREL